MAIIKKYRSLVTDIKSPIPGIYVVSLKSLEKPYRYLPGQFLHLALDAYDPSSPWPESRCFSMQSCDQDETILITFAAKGAFTNRMAGELAAGKEVTLKLPYGDLFSQTHSKDNTVFIAGGTGVTPFLSLFSDKVFLEYREPRLYLGVRDKNYNIYRNEIERAASRNAAFKTEVICQDTDGMLNIGNIFEKNGIRSDYFVSGPPLMIRNFRKYLVENGLSAEKVHTDDWE